MRLPSSLFGLPSSVFGLRSSVIGLSALLLLGTTATRADASSLNGKLHWKNGDQLPGELLDGTRTHLRWQSPAFVTPFSLDIRYLDAIRCPPPAHPLRVADPLRLETLSGNVLYGELAKITPTHITLNCRRHGQIQIRRSAVLSLRGMDNPVLIDFGPTGLAGWKTLSRGRRVSEWKTNAENHLSTKVVGAELFRDLKLPTVAEVDIALQWQRKPGFLISFAPPKTRRISSKAVKLETWDDELVLQTLATNGEFENLRTITAKTKSLRLRLLWQQKSGQLSVYSENGRLLGRMSGKGGARGHTGLYIQNKGSDLTLVHVRVSKGSAVPSADDDAPSHVHLIDGTMIRGQVQRYDASSRSLVVREAAGGRRTVPMDQFAGVFWGDSTKSPPLKPPIQLAFHDGTRLGGKLKSIRGETIVLQTGYSAQAIASRLDGLNELTFNTDGAAPDRAGVNVLTLRGTTLHGKLAPAGASGSEFGWQPVGSDNASPLPTSHVAQIVREEKGKEAKPDAYVDVLYLRNGDIVPCRIARIDEAHVCVDTIFAESTLIPHSKVKAVEFNAAAVLPTTGFGGSGWVVAKGQERAVKRDHRKITFRGQAKLGHADLLRGDEIEFDLKWNPNASAALNFHLFTPDAKRSSNTSMLVYITGQQLFVRGARQGRRWLGMRRPLGITNGKAKMKMTWASKKLRVFLNDKEVYSQSLNRKDRAGRGLVISTQRMGRARQVVIVNGKRQVVAEKQEGDLLTISNFRVQRSGGPFGSLLVDDRKKDAVLTVPRFRKNNPPTHVLVAQNGDLLRGRLVGVNDDRADFVSRLDAFAFPRERLAAIIWLEDNSNPPNSTLLPGKLTVQATMTNGAAFTFTADKMTTDRIMGRHSLLGDCRLPIDAVRKLELGKKVRRIDTFAYADWKLHPAKEPQFVGSAAGGPGAGVGDAFGIDSPLVGTGAEDFRAELLDGRKFRLRDHADKIVILDFWATWCAPCVQSLPNMIKLTKAYPPGQVIFVAVNQQENAAVIREFLETRGWDLTVALDRDGSIGKKFQADSIPQTVIVGPGGKIERLHVGAHAGLHAEIDKVLKQLVKPDAADEIE